MAQDYLNLQTTEAGLAMVARAMYGDKITFTKLVIGNGKPDSDDPSAVANPLVEVGITKIDRSESRVLLTGYLTSADIEASFYGTELGVYAKDASDNEVLFAYRYNATDVDYYPATSSGRAIELTFSIVTQVGSAENVTAILIEGDTYASKEAFDKHVADMSNPHGVTALQLGLDKVENKAINDQTPTYQAQQSTSELVSGEPMSTALAKIAAAVKALISHISDKSNPHGVTASGIGAAALSHQHSAADVNSGTLSVLRGGTGAGDAATARTNLGLKNGATATFAYDSSSKTLTITTS